MLKPEDEMSSEGLPKIYIDEVLEKSLDTYHSFVQDLHARNMLDYVPEASSLCSLFFVCKKNGCLRMVLDCRASNELFRQPPDIAMPAGYPFAQLQVGKEGILYTVQSDIKDYF